MTEQVQAEQTAEAAVTDANIAQSEDWRASLPEELRHDKVFDSVKDVASLAKQFKDAQSYMGNSIRIPGEDAGQEAIDAFHQKLMSKTGLMLKPETPEDYAKVFESMGKPSDAKEYALPEGVEGYDNIKEMALNANLTNKQFQDLMSQVAQFDAQAMEQQVNAQKESRDALQKEWGAAFDRNQSRALNALEASGAPDNLIELVKAGNVDGESLKWFYALSNKLGGGEGSNATEDKGGNLVMTPAEAQAQLAEVMNNPIYMDTAHPRHKEFQDKAMTLRRLRSAG